MIAEGSRFWRRNFLKVTLRPFTTLRMLLGLVTPTPGHGQGPRAPLPGHRLVRGLGDLDSAYPGHLR